MSLRILVTGSHGQLGSCIRKIAASYPHIDFSFSTTTTLDITKTSMVSKVFENGNFNFCINAAAYTNVEQAEKTPKPAFEINGEGVKNIAEACAKYQVTLIHISTDYVFDGEKNTPYTVDDAVGPINEYGKSKLAGEIHIQALLERYFIVRTSWLYSEFGHNFYKTIVRKAKEEDVLWVTEQEIGCPTDANNLARFIIENLILESKAYGVHHFTDGEVMSWYGFAKKIVDELGVKVKVESKNYPTFAKRPKYSVLDIGVKQP
ncbi:dTDP-4-dehydrorhamnose reductase [Spongiimicrobium salis]|uniref:dTDP-4-dehydrorhamnose reductase n=1 Tax=Spongiimicrobium salis TaxID=1667022 RepID=UPI00374D1A92